MDASILPARHGGLTLLQAQEVLYPCIDDPYLLGRISCATVLSSMYAIGVPEIDNMLMKLSVSNQLSEKERDVVVPQMIKVYLQNHLQEARLKDFRGYIYASLYKFGLSVCLFVCLSVCIQYTSKRLNRSGPNFLWDIT